VKKLLSYVNVMIDNPPENIVYFYAEYQDTFGEIQNLVPGIKFVQGLPDDILDCINPETRNFNKPFNWQPKIPILNNLST
jgi:aminopeptidase C